MIDINVAQELLKKKQFPHVPGLQNTLLGPAKQWKTMAANGVQIIHERTTTGSASQP